MALVICFIARSHHQTWVKEWQDICRILPVTQNLKMKWFLSQPVRPVMREAKQRDFTEQKVPEVPAGKP